jgi:hypothetical protein
MYIRTYTCMNRLPFDKTPFCTCLNSVAKSTCQQRLMEAWITVPKQRYKCSVSMGTNPADPEGRVWYQGLPSVAVRTFETFVE